MKNIEFPPYLDEPSKPAWENPDSELFRVWFDAQDTKPEEEQSPEFRQFLELVAQGAVVVDIDTLRARRAVWELRNQERGSGRWK